MFSNILKADDISAEEKAKLIPFTAKQRAEFTHLLRMFFSFVFTEEAAGSFYFDLATLLYDNARKGNDISHVEKFTDDFPP